MEVTKKLQALKTTVYNFVVAATAVKEESLEGFHFMLPSTSVGRIRAENYRSITKTIGVQATCRQRPGNRIDITEKKR